MGEAHTYPVPRLSAGPCYCGRSQTRRSSASVRLGSTRGVFSCLVGGSRIWGFELLVPQGGGEAVCLVSPPGGSSDAIPTLGAQEGVPADVARLSQAQGRGGVGRAGSRCPVWLRMAHGVLGVGQVHPHLRLPGSCL